MQQLQIDVFVQMCMRDWRMLLHGVIVAPQNLLGVMRFRRFSEAVESTPWTLAMWSGFPMWTK